MQYIKEEIQEVKTKEELNEFVSKMVNQTKINEEIAYLLRDKIFDILLLKGDIFSNEYLNLYKLFKEIKITKDDRYTQYIKILEENYFNVSLEEKYLYVNLLFGFYLLNGEIQKGLYSFISKVIEFDLVKAVINENGEFFIEYLKQIEVKDKDVIDIVNQILNKELLNNNNRLYIIKNIIYIIWNIPIMYNNKIWLNVMDKLLDLLNLSIKHQDIETQMALYFLTYHIYGNNIDSTNDWKYFTNKVEKPATYFYNDYIKKLNLTQINPKKGNIGIILDRLVMNSPFQMIYSLINILSKSGKYNIFVYSLNYIDKNPEDIKIIEMIEKIGVKVYSPEDECEGIYYSHLKKVMKIRNKIIQDNIYTLISGFSGYDMSNFLFTSRSAKKQVYWSHGNCDYDILNIDIRISHFHQECKEFEWNILDIPIYKPFLVGTGGEKTVGEIIKQDYKSKFGDDLIILGTIGRLVKIDNEEYIKTIANIMKENKNTIYLACGDGNEENIKKLLKKYEIEENRFIFTGQINPHIYGWVIDVWLDSFPLIGGHSVEEFKAKGGVVIRYIPDEKLDSLNKHINILFDEISWVQINQANELLKEKIEKMIKDIPIEVSKYFRPFLKDFNKEKAFIIFLYKWVNSIERYIEFSNFFIQHKEVLEFVKEFYNKYSEFLEKNDRILMNKVEDLLI